MENRNSLPTGYILKSKKYRYTIKSHIASGSFGNVYTANCSFSVGNVPFEITVALKEYSVHSGFGSGTVSSLTKQDFIREANLLMQLCSQSKHIVQVNEVFEANDKAYFAMEYIAGGTLHTDSKAQAIEYIEELSEAVKALHDKRIAHMDIKPSNVLLKEDGESGETYPVLIDFGIAMQFDKNGQPVSGSQPRGATPGYAPLEQYGSISSFSPAIDTYAMGAMLYYLLTGNSPQDAWALRNDDSSLREGLSSACCDEFIPFVAKAMATDPNDRFQNIDDFIKGLKTVGITADNIMHNQAHGEKKIAPTTVEFPNHMLGNEDVRSSQDNEGLGLKDGYVAIGKLAIGDNTVMDSVIRGRMDSMIIAKHPLTNLYGILDDKGNEQLPFEYDSIGDFVEVPDGRGGNFSFGKRVVAPALKAGENPTVGIGISQYGAFWETQFDETMQGFFGRETVSSLLIREAFLKDGEIAYICTNCDAKYGITDAKGNVLAPFIYDSIGPFTEYCSLPAPGFPRAFFGAKYTIGDKVGFFRITENGVLCDYARYHKEKYNRLFYLT